MRATRFGVRGQKGVTLIWMALFLFVMLAFIGIGVDVAKLMATRSQLQNAADAAALAGASIYGTSGDSSSVKAQVAVSAINFAAKNRAFEEIPTVVVVPDTDVVTNYAQKTCKVTTRRENATGMVTHFLKVIGLGKLPISATATAKAEGGCRYVPFAVQPPPSDTNWVVDKIYLLKNAPPNGTQGSYGAVEFPACPDDPCSKYGGASQYQCWITVGYPCCEAIKVGDCLPSEPGNMSGPTTSGVQTLIDTDSDMRVGILYDKTDPNAYHGNNNRVVIAPLTGPVDQLGCSGKSYKVLDLGVFFLTNYASGSGGNNTVYGQYLGHPDDLGLTAKPYTVRLIQ